MGHPRQPATGPDPARISTVLCDLDGVVWLAQRPIPGASQAVADLRASGRRVVFVTNNSVDTVAAQVRALAAVGVPARGDVVTSAMAAGSLLRAGERVLVVGGPGIDEAVGGAGAVVAHDDSTSPFHAVVVGLDRSFDFERLRIASRAIRDGARFVATNSDATFPTPRGLEPGGGAIVAAVATASGAAPELAGKPHAPMARLIAEVVGGPAGFDPSTTVMVGDRPETDGRFAAVLGCPYAAVRTGVLEPGAPIHDDVDVAYDVADLGALAALLLDAPVTPPRPAR